MKVELIVSIGLVAVGALIGAGFATGGAWLDIADKLSSVISCIVTCVAFIFAWKAYHSWKSPLLLEAYEATVAVLQQSSFELMHAILVFKLNDLVIEGIPDAIVQEITDDQIMGHSKLAVKALNHFTSKFPSSILMKIHRLNPTIYTEIVSIQAAGLQLKKQMLSLQNRPAEFGDYHARSKLLTDASASLVDYRLKILALEQLIKDAHGAML